MYFVNSYKNFCQITLTWMSYHLAQKVTPLENDASNFFTSLTLATTAGMNVAFIQSCSISMKTTQNCLLIDTNIHIYVPFCKSVDDVTIRLSLRHHF